MPFPLVWSISRCQILLGLSEWEGGGDLTWLTLTIRKGKDCCTFLWPISSEFHYLVLRRENTKCTWRLRDETLWFGFYSYCKMINLFRSALHSMSPRLAAWGPRMRGHFTEEKGEKEKTNNNEINNRLRVAHKKNIFCLTRLKDDGPTKCVMWCMPEKITQPNKGWYRIKQVSLVISYFTWCKIIMIKRLW